MDCGDTFAEVAAARSAQMVSVAQGLQLGVGLAPFGV